MEEFKNILWGMAKYALAAFMTAYISLAIFYYMAFDDFPPRLSTFRAMAKSTTKKAQEPNPKAPVLPIGRTPEETVERLQRSIKNEQKLGAELTAFANHESVDTELQTSKDNYKNQEAKQDHSQDRNLDHSWDHLEEDYGRLRLELDAQRFQMQAFEAELKAVRKELQYYRAQAPSRAATTYVTRKAPTKSGTLRQPSSAEQR